METDNQNCACYAVELKINEDFPGYDWNLDAKCDAWGERSEALPVVDQGPHHGDYDYACCCPTCGRSVCGWCA